MRLEIDGGAYHLRKARKNDSLKISILIIKCLKEINWNYPKENREEIKGMISTRTKEGILEKLKKKEIFLLFDKEKLVATIGLEKNILCLLYVHPDYNRKGIGSLMVDFIEGYAKGYKLTKKFFYKSPKGIKFLVKQMEKRI